MPFGFFGIDKRKKNEEPPVPPYVPPAPPVIPTPPPPMPAPEPVVTPRPEPTYNVPAWNVAPGATVRILLVAETLELAKDYLCSLKLNADETLATGGLAYFSNDPATIAETIMVKKDIDRCFWGDPNVRWPKYPEIIMEEKEHMYTFSICVSGYQTKTLDVAFCCVTPYMSVSKYMAEADSVWILNNDTSDRESENEYESSVKQLLFSNSQNVKNKDIIVLISQFEKKAGYRDNGALAEIDLQFRKRLIEGCKTVYEDVFTALGINGKICPVQIYGGLEFLEYNENRKPVFYVDPVSSCGSYSPQACQLPLLHAITSARSKGMEFFMDMSGEKLWLALQNSYSDYIGRKQWEVITII